MVRNKSSPLSFHSFAPLALALNPLNWPGPDFLALFIAMYLIALIMGLVIRSRATRSSESVDTDSVVLSMPQIAYLNGGQRQMAILSISQMIQDGAVKIEELKRSRWLNPKPPCLRSQGPLPPYADDVSQLIYHEASQPKGLNVYSLRQILEPRGNRIKETLEDLQLLNRNRSNMRAGLPMFVVIAAAFAKLIWVFGTHRPVGFLILGTVIAFATSVLLIYQRRLTTAGTRYLQRMKQSSHHLQFFKKATYGGLAPADMAMSIAMFGLMDSTSPELTAFHSAIAHSNSSRGCGSSCGSSCGGGGGCGGGGCGGCGGGS